MDITKLATQMLAAKLGGSTQGNALQDVLGGLLGSQDNNAQSNNGIDLSSLISGLQNGGLSNLAESWLGDGDNEEISESQLESVLGNDKIADAASKLGTNPNDLLAGLKDVLPQLVDKSSKGGSLLDQVGGLSGLASLASKFLK